MEEHTRAGRFDDRDLRAKTRHLAVSVKVQVFRARRAGKGAGVGRIADERRSCRCTASSRRAARCHRCADPPGFTRRPHLSSARPTPLSVSSPSVGHLGRYKSLVIVDIDPSSLGRLDDLHIGRDHVDGRRGRKGILAAQFVPAGQGGLVGRVLCQVLLSRYRSASRRRTACCRPSPG